MKLTFKLFCTLAAVSVLTLAGVTHAEVFNDGRIGIEKVVPSEIRASEDMLQEKSAAEDTFEARLETVDEELAGLREQIEARSPNGEMIDAAIVSLETKREAAEAALNDYKDAAMNEWAVTRNRAERAFGEMNAALDQAYNEVLAH